LLSTKTFKALGTLDYHKGGCQAIVFANPPVYSIIKADSEDESDEEGPADVQKRSRWLISGGSDCKVAIWALIDFEKLHGV
jgi:ASTRA-associated protein 1